MIEQTADKTRISCGLVRGIPEEETMEKHWFPHSGKAHCHISLTFIIIIIIMFLKG
jgi:hypothetical protein